MREGRFTETDMPHERFIIHQYALVGNPIEGLEARPTV